MGTFVGRGGNGFKRWVRENSLPLLAACAVNGLLLLAAAGIVVVRVLRTPEPEFAAVVDVEVPPEPWEQELEEGAVDAGAAAAQSELERVRVDLPLPEGPVLPAYAPGAPSETASADLLSGLAQGFLDQAGFAGLSSASTAGGAASFFGVEDTGDRIVLIVNTSASVLRRARARGVSIERIQSEVVSVVEGLDPRCEFGLVHFSQGVRLFAPRLAPATPANRKVFSDWVSASLRGNPPVREGAPSTGHEAALEEALALEPDVIFLVTDGQLERRVGSPGAWTYPVIPTDEFLRSVRRMKGGGRAVRLHIIGFELGVREREAMGRLARDFGGQVREF